MSHADRLDIDDDADTSAARQAPSSDRDESDTEARQTSSGGMTRRELAALLCKSVSLLLFAQSAFFSIAGLAMIAVLFVGGLFTRTLYWEEFSLPLIASVPMLAAAAVAAVFWWNADAIAARMVSDEPAPVGTLPFNVRDLTIVAFSVAGVFVLVDGIRDAVPLAVALRMFGPGDTKLWEHPTFWTSVFQLALAGWLMLGSRGIVVAIQRLRTAGQRHLDEEPRHDPSS